jgi:hypothetical protein
MSKNYMQDIYDVINAPEEEVNDQGIEYLDEPIDEDNFYYEDELAWADDITYLDDPEDDEFNLDLGDGFIPLPQGDNYEEELVVIDEEYMLDEFEVDLVDDCAYPTIETSLDNDYTDDIYNIINEAESIIKFSIHNEPQEEELKVTNMNSEDSALATAIAKEHLDNVKAGENVGALYGDLENPEDDTSWVNDKDLFGADLSVIIADDPEKEVEEEDFVEGSFEDWLSSQDNQ